MKRIVLAGCLFVLGSFALEAQIKISEIMYNPPEPGTDTLEYLELYNAGTTPVNLEGYSFSPGPVVTFPNMTLPAGGFMILCKSQSYFQSLFGPVPALEWTSGALSNTGGTLTLLDAGGNTVTTVSYTNASPWPGGQANGNGSSIALCDLQGDDNDPSLWRASTVPTGIFHYGKELLTSLLAPSGCVFPEENGLLITGVFDAQPGAAGAKGVEIYALKDIADLGIYGIGSANNGAGSNGEEFGFPSVALSEGDFIYVAADSALFRSFFGFDADYISSAVNINGDDAIELFEVGEVIDLFGETTVDGTGQPWEYTDGWAYRINETGPDGNTFILSNWKFSGVGGLTGSPTNAGAPKPFPLGSYLPPSGVLKANDDFFTVEINSPEDLPVQANDLKPEPLVLFEILAAPQQGTASVAGDVISYIPDQGYCGPDQITYRICDAISCDTALVSITVSCPKAYPLYTIGSVRSVNTEGVLDSLGVECELQGIVHGVNLRPGGLQIVIIDTSGIGITVFSASDLGYTPVEGDRISVKGVIAQYNGLAQMQPVQISPLPSQGQPLATPVVVTVFDEFIESRLVRLEQVQLVDPSQWSNSGSGFNVQVTNGQMEFTLRIDNDVDLYGTPPPTGKFTVTGLGTQFDSSNPFTEGYQLMPRYQADIKMLSSIDGSHSLVTAVWPNPAVSVFTVQAQDVIQSIRIYDAWGRLLQDLQLDGGQTEVRMECAGFPAGIYTVVAVSVQGQVGSVPVCIGER